MSGRSTNQAFVVWLTGLPASGKSTVARALTTALRDRGAAVEVLESDELRKLLTPEPTYATAERDTFYTVVVHMARLLSRHGVNVVIDATGNRRAYRDAARSTCPRFLEVFVDTPAEVCARRDPKGLYAKARAGEVKHLPGAGDEYEPPTNAEVHLQDESVEQACDRVIQTLNQRGWL